MIGAHPTNDPTNPLHRLADDAARMASGAYPRRPEDLAGIARDIDEALTLIASLQPPDPNRVASDSDLRVRMFTQPADDPTWMHFWFTRPPTEDERQAIARAVSLRVHYLEPAQRRGSWATMRQSERDISRKAIPIPSSKEETVDG
jgi:hypothetical protein